MDNTKNSTEIFIETRKRTFWKSVIWRSLAILNSFLVLCFYSSTNLNRAIAMNLSGFIIYYIFERLFGRLSWGKVKLTQEEK